MHGDFDNARRQGGKVVLNGSIRDRKVLQPARAPCRDARDVRQDEA